MGFSPSDLDELRLWLRAESLAALDDGDAVATWPDGSGNDLDLTQSSSSLRPVIKANQINGRPAVRFHDTWLSHADDALLKPTALSMFVIVRAESSGTGYDKLLAKESGAGLVYPPGPWSYALLSNGNSVETASFLYEGAQDAQVITSPGSHYSTSSYYVLSARAKPGAQEMWLNNERQFARSVTGAIVHGATPLYLGRGFSSELFYGDVVEVVLVGKYLDDQTFEQVNNYLGCSINASWSPCGDDGGALAQLDRIRSAVSEDAGSIFEATNAIAIDAAISEAFPWGTAVTAGDNLGFAEAFRPSEVTRPYQAIPVRNQELRVTVQGETIMSRLARTIPSRIMTRVEDIAGETDDTMTVQEAMQHVFDTWSDEFDWFRAEDVPDLRLLVPLAVTAPKQHYIDHPTDGVLTTQAIAIPQETSGDQDSRQTMRDVIDEWLAIFPGTIVRANSTGRVEIVPRVGPDASDTVRTLTWSDLKAISEGAPDPRGIINQARVVSQGWSYEADQELLPESFLVFTTGQGLGRSVLVNEGVLPDVEEVQPYALAAFEGLVQTGTSVTVSVTVTAYGSSQQDSSSSFDTLGTNTESVTLDVGESADVGVAFFARLLPVAFLVTITNDGDGVRVAPSTGANAGIPGRVFNPFGSTYMAFVVTLNSVTGTGWTKSAERVIGSFGFESTDSLPAPDGGDALSDSIDRFGERQATINSSQFQLTPEQAQQVARAYVLSRISPRTVRDVQQSLWDRYPVRFDDIGRPIELPTGETAIVEHRDYSDASTASALAVASSFSAVVTDTTGLDTTTDWLLLDSGDYLVLDDGSLAEPA